MEPNGETSTNKIQGPALPAAAAQVPHELEDGPLDKEKAPHRIPPDAFDEVYGLLGSLPWLHPRSGRLIALWNECDTQAQRKLLSRLLRRFTHVDSPAFEKGCGEIAQLITQDWRVPQESTLIVAAAQNSESDGSQHFLYSLKVALGDTWEERNFVSRITSVERKLDGIDLIIVVDDFTGSGTKITRKIMALRKALLEASTTAECEIAFISFAGMENAAAALDSLNCRYHVHRWCKKGISQISAADEIEAEIAEMRDLESKLADRWKERDRAGYSLGFRQCEALYILDGKNIPNNVFPVFWWPFKTRSPTLYSRTSPN